MHKKIGILLVIKNSLIILKFIECRKEFCIFSVKCEKQVILRLNFDHYNTKWNFLQSVFFIFIHEIITYLTTLIKQLFFFLSNFYENCHFRLVFISKFLKEFRERLQFITFCIFHILFYYFIYIIVYFITFLIFSIFYSSTFYIFSHFLFFTFFIF